MNIKTGIEIECLLNDGEFSDMEIGNYREGIKIPKLGWLAESDSSIHGCSDDLDYSYNEVELISPVTNNRKDFFEELNKFIQYFSRNGKYQLNQVMCFNRSCGSHIHFSLNRKPMWFTNKVDKKHLINMRKYFLERLIKSHLPDRIKWGIMGHYARSYSKQSWVNHSRVICQYEKHYEFNFGSERSGKGLEWRGINMLGIQTWGQFLEFWRIVYDSLEYLIKIMGKWTNNFRVKIPTEDYIQDKETIIVSEYY